MVYAWVYHTVQSYVVQPVPNKSIDTVGMTGLLGEGFLPPAQSERLGFPEFFRWCLGDSTGLASSHFFLSVTIWVGQNIIQQYRWQIADPQSTIPDDAAARAEVWAAGIHDGRVPIGHTSVLCDPPSKYHLIMFAWFLPMFIFFSGLIFFSAYICHRLTQW